MRILFLGQGKLAQICISVLLEGEFGSVFDLRSVVTSKAFYQGLQSEYPACRDIDFIPNESRNEDLILKSLEAFGIETLISVQHKWILGSEVIEAVSGQAFNLHNARLPDYKGHNTISFAILNDAREYAATIHWIVPEVDCGDIILESAVRVSSLDTAYSLYARMLPIVRDAFRDFLEMLLRNELPRNAPAGEGAYYSKGAWEQNKVIASGDDFGLIDRKVRTSFFPPYEPAYMEIDGKKIYCLPDSSGPELWSEKKPLNKSSWDELNPVSFSIK